MGKKSGSGSGMHNPDPISKSLETIFWVKILKFFVADPGWKNSDPESVIRDKHPGSATLKKDRPRTGKSVNPAHKVKFRGISYR